MRRAVATIGVVLAALRPVHAQPSEACRVLCTPDFKVEPTITFTNVFGSPRTQAEDGSVIREPRETDFEVILSLGLPTRLSWLDFTVEAIVLPFDPDGTPELEFESNVVWLPARATGGWLSSHVDIVDKFSAAERPTDGRAYTHKFNVELDTSVRVFNWLPEGRWLRGMELEGSLDLRRQRTSEGGADNRRPPVPGRCQPVVVVTRVRRAGCPLVENPAFSRAVFVIDAHD